MGNVGGAFGQAFANTLVQGSQIIEAVKDRRDDLELRKKFADVQFKDHDLRTKLITRQLQTELSLRDRLQPTTHEWPDSELAAGGAAVSPAAPLSEHEKLKFALGLGDSPAAKWLLSGNETKTAEPGRAILDNAGRVTGFVPYAPGQSPAELNAAPPPAWMAPFLGGGAAPQPATGGPAASGMPGGPGAPTLPAGGGPSGGGPRIDFVPSVTRTKDGAFVWTLNGQQTNHQFGTTPRFDPATQSNVIVPHVFDPTLGKIVETGPPVPAPMPDEVIALGAEATRMGLKPGTDEHEYGMLMLQSAKRLPDDVRTELLAQLQHAAKTGGALPSIRTAQAAAAARRVTQEKTTATAQAEGRLAVPERPSDAARERMAKSQSSIDLYNQIGVSYRPEFVGPVRGTFGVVPGGIRAAVRQRTGTMSQSEQRFRTNIALANNGLIRDMSGANVPPGEMARVEKQLPDPELPPAQFEARFAAAKLYAKATAIRQRQIDEATGVAVSRTPKISLTTEERRALAEPILAEFLRGQITRADAVEQLMGLSGYGEPGAQAFLSAGGRR